VSNLGGYVPTGDPATWFPDLWTWLVRELNLRSVIDVGCGEGQALDFFAGLGCDVVGVEGTLQFRVDILQHDYEQAALHFARDFDLCWCCEFVEHVREEYIPNFMATFAHAKLIALTHAFPGQPGWNHVNCQPPSYWIAQMDSYGFDYDHELSLLARVQAAHNVFTWTDSEGEHVNHFLRSGLIFIRR
jgi:SAM-dependent methyltransferase